MILRGVLFWQVWSGHLLYTSKQTSTRRVSLSKGSINPPPKCGAHRLSRFGACFSRGVLPHGQMRMKWRETNFSCYVNAKRLLNGEVQSKKHSSCITREFGYPPITNWLDTDGPSCLSRWRNIRWVYSFHSDRSRKGSLLVQSWKWLKLTFYERDCILDLSVCLTIFFIPWCLGGN